MSLLCHENDKESDPVCQACPWYDKDFVVSGWRSSPIAVVCEMPTDEDYMDSQLFSGPSGDLVNGWLEESGLSISEVSQLSVVKCSAGKEKPSQVVVAHCRPHLISDIDYIADRGLKIVVPLGATATRGFFKVSKFMDVRGHVNRMQFGSSMITVVPTLSTAHIFSKRGHVEIVKKDFSTIARLSKGLSVDKLLGESITICDVLRTRDSIKHFFTVEIPKHRVVSIDIETTGYDTVQDMQVGNPLDFLSGDLLTINFSFAQGKGVVLPLLGYKAKKVWTDSFKAKVYGWLRDVLHSDSILWLLHNAPFDLKFLSHLVGIEVSKVRFADTMLMSHLLWEESPKDLKSLAHVYTNMGGYESIIKG